MHISSILVSPRPGISEDVHSRLSGMEGVEVHGASPEGQLIVTIETADNKSMVDAFESITRMDGVLAASMVYHQQESDPEAEITLATSQGSRIDKEV